VRLQTTALIGVGGKSVVPPSVRNCVFCTIILYTAKTANVCIVVAAFHNLLI